MWMAYRLEAGRPRQSEALAEANGRERKALSGPSLLHWGLLALTFRSEDMSHLLVSTQVGAFVAGPQHLFLHLYWAPGFGGSGLP